MPQSRRMLVLRAVVEDYIRSQEPVGSGSLTKQHDLGVSSATVRNDMAALEDEGYLIQPHTSAGRVPTEKGYRYFVDRLATVVPLSKAQRNGIDSFLSGSASLQDTLQRAARLLARITGQVAVVASPSLARSTLRHVELVPVAMATLLAVVITDTGRVAQHTIVVQDMPSTRDLGEFTDAVNAGCAGLSLPAAAGRVRALPSRPRFRDLAPLAERLAQAFASMADDERASELYMSGASSLAHQRAVSDLAPLFDALEEQVVLMKLMSALSEESPRVDGVGVAIGSETHTPGLMHAAVVSSGYGHADTDRTSGADGTASGPEPGADAAPVARAAVENTAGEPVAFIGSIGPTHMDYATTIAAVRAVARYLTAFLADGETGESGRGVDGNAGGDEVDSGASPSAPATPDGAEAPDQAGPSRIIPDRAL
ncbi:heat-inducible transcriptional repressor HrcA [Bifidobacterium rousetti]|nr:heat-inducible transcriptional repressor HrcA [Bifidobacterium rousetti]